SMNSSSGNFFSCASANACPTSLYHAIAGSAAGGLGAGGSSAPRTPAATISSTEIPTIRSRIKIPSPILRGATGSGRLLPVLQSTDHRKSKKTHSTATDTSRNLNAHTAIALAANGSGGATGSGRLLPVLQSTDSRKSKKTYSTVTDTSR